jgi:hypothetical protein
MDRRNFIHVSAAWLLLANAPPRLLDRAMDRAGGYSALHRVRKLTWTGRATITAPQGRTIVIGVRTEVVPFLSARSDSWLLSDGPAKTNTLIIEPSRAWIIRAGRDKQAMPDAMAAHERAQYALYGLMLLAPLDDRGAIVKPRASHDTLEVQHEGAPPTVFGFDDQGKLVWATNEVPSPEGVAVIEQRFTFDGEITSGKVRWPQRIKIEQDGSPYFDLQLDTFLAA